MPDVKLTLEAEPYFCRECLEERDEHVTALVRMIPASMVLFDKLVGEEWWCCPVCQRPKFDTRRRPASVKRELARKAIAKERAMVERSLHKFLDPEENVVRLSDLKKDK